MLTILWRQQVAKAKSLLRVLKGSAAEVSRCRAVIYESNSNTLYILSFT
jgi:hypothetical protein